MTLKKNAQPGSQVAERWLRRLDAAEQRALRAELERLGIFEDVFAARAAR